jgi:hypothetical protein
VNYGVGIEQKLDDQWKGYFSVRADKSSYDNGVVQEGYEDSILNYDLYHAVVGASYRTDRAETSFGVQYSYGRNDQAAQAADFASANEANLFCRRG